MGSFLLNEFGEVLLEVPAKLDFGLDLRLEINEAAQTAVLKNQQQSFEIDFVHPELMLPLKQNRYLVVVERRHSFYAGKSLLTKVVFVN